MEPLDGHLCGAGDLECVCDANGRVVSTRMPSIPQSVLGGRRHDRASYHYDDDGRLIRVVTDHVLFRLEQPSENIIEYDGERRRLRTTSISIGDGTRQKLLTHYVYNERGWLIEERMSSSLPYIDPATPHIDPESVTYKWGERGRLMRMIVESGGTADNVYGFQYDDQGRRVTVSASYRGGLESYCRYTPPCSAPEGAVMAPCPLECR